MLQSDRADFHKTVSRLAIKCGVHCEIVAEEIGEWNGKYEPSFLLEIRGNDQDEIKFFLQELRRKYNQAAIIVLIPDEEGKGFHASYAFEPPLEQEQSDELLSELLVKIEELQVQLKRIIGFSLQATQTCGLSHIHFYGSGDQDNLIADNLKIYLVDSLECLKTHTNLVTRRQFGYEIQLIEETEPKSE